MTVAVAVAGAVAAVAVGEEGCQQRRDEATRCPHSQPHRILRPPMKANHTTAIRSMRRMRAVCGCGEAAAVGGRVVREGGGV